MGYPLLSPHDYEPEITDVDALRAHRKTRLAPEIAKARGWTCRGVARLLVVGDSTTSRRRIGALGTTYRSAFPVSGREVDRWLLDRRLRVGARVHAVAEDAELRPDPGHVAARAGEEVLDLCHRLEAVQ